MPYDLDLVHQLCHEVGLRSIMRSQERLEIDLGQSLVLCFLNSERDQDCLVAFEGTPWHAHGDFTFTDRHGNCVDLSYLDIVTGLKDGHVLVCERWHDEKLVDRWLIHRDCNDEFGYMKEGDEIRVRSFAGVGTSAE